MPVNQAAHSDVHPLSLKVKSNPPSWAGDTLRSLPKDTYFELKGFLRKRHRSHRGVVSFRDMRRFVSNTTALQVDWERLMRHCEKKCPGERALWGADYWMNTQCKEGMSFISLDQNILISKGLYRAALARYVLQYQEADTLYGVKVDRWCVDWDAYHTWSCLHRICSEHFPQYTVTPLKELQARTREGHWRVEDYGLSLRCKDDQGGERDMGLKEAADWLRQLAQEAGIAVPEYSPLLLKHQLFAA